MADGNLGYCAISPGVIAYNYTRPAVVGNAVAASEATSRAGADFVEPFKTGMELLSIPAGGIGGVYGGTKSLLLSMLAPPFSAVFGAWNPYSTALEGCTGLAREVAGKSYVQLRDEEIGKTE